MPVDLVLEQSIAITGMPHSGASEVADIVGKILKWPVIDLTNMRAAREFRRARSLNTKGGDARAYLKWFNEHFERYSLRALKQAMKATSRPVIFTGPQLMSITRHMSMDYWVFVIDPGRDRCVQRSIDEDRKDPEWKSEHELVSAYTARACYGVYAPFLKRCVDDPDVLALDVDLGIDELAAWVLTGLAVERDLRKSFSRLTN